MTEEKWLTRMIFLETVAGEILWSVGSRRIFCRITQLEPLSLRQGATLTQQIEYIHHCLHCIAGVPGMVAAMCRHFASLRTMRRDNGWVHTLLEEAENERAHLLTFLEIKQPGFLFRTMVLGAQGVFFNAYFLGYLVSPAFCHRFV